MKPEQLETIGRDLFGHGWQTQLAKLLGVSRKTVNLWASGRHPISREWAYILEDAHADLSLFLLKWHKQR